MFLLQNLTVDQYLVWSRAIGWPLGIAQTLAHVVDELCLGSVGSDDSAEIFLWGLVEDEQRSRAVNPVEAS